MNESRPKTYSGEVAGLWERCGGPCVGDLGTCKKHEHHHFEDAQWYGLDESPAAKRGARQDDLIERLGKEWQRSDAKVSHLSAVVLVLAETLEIIRTKYGEPPKNEIEKAFARVQELEAERDSQ